MSGFFLKHECSSIKTKKTPKRFVTCYLLPPPSGGTGGIQNQHQQAERLFEKEPSCQREVASLRLPVLLLHGGLQSVARYLPQQESESARSLI